MLNNTPKHPKVTVLDSIMGNPKLSHIVKEAMAASPGSPARIKAQKLFKVTGAVNNNYYIPDGQGGPGDFTNISGAYATNDPMAGLPTFSPTSSLPGMGGPTTSTVLSSPSYALDSKRKELAKSKRFEYSGDIGFGTPAEAVAPIVGNIVKWFGNYGLAWNDIIQNSDFTKKPGQSNSQYLSTINPFRGLGEAFIPSRKYSFQGGAKPSTKSSTSKGSTGSTSSGGGASSGSEEQLPPPPNITKDQLQNALDQAGENGMSPAQLLISLGIDPTTLGSSFQGLDINSLLQSAMGGGNQGTSLNLPGGLQGLANDAKSSLGLNTYIKQSIPKLDQMFSGLPEGQKPFGVADLGQIDALDKTLRNELHLDDQLSGIREMQQNYGNIESDIKDYIKGKDQHLGKLDDMIKKANLDLGQLDMSNPYVAQRAQSYLDYLNTLKTRTQTRYDDFLKDSSTFYQNKLDSSINLYNDSLDKYQKLFTQGSNTIRDNYNSAVGLLTDMYNSANNSEKDALSLQHDRLALGTDTLAFLDQYRKFTGNGQGDQDMQTYFDNQPEYKRIFDDAQFQSRLDLPGSTKPIMMFNGSVDEVLNYAKSVGLPEYGAAKQLASNIANNFLDAQSDPEIMQKIADHYTSIIGQYIQAHAQDQGDYSKGLAGTLIEALKTGLKSAYAGNPQAIRGAINALVNGGYKNLPDWYAKVTDPSNPGEYVGKNMADAIKKYYDLQYDVMIKQSVSGKSVKNLGQLFTNFNSPDGNIYQNFDDMPDSVISSELIPAIVDENFRS